jgi:sugar/nucleoside kinase (ribokinase family)
VVRDGANGAWLALPGRTARHIPPHPVRPVDTNGAGDTHVGAFVAALASGHAPATACRLANIAAALSTTKEGPATAPPLADVLAIAASHPIPMQQEA